VTAYGKAQAMRVFTILAAMSLVVCLATTMLSVANSNKARRENRASLSPMLAAVDAHFERVNAAFQELDAFTKSRGPVLSTEDSAHVSALSSVTNRLIAEQNQLTTEEIRLGTLTLTGPPVAYRTTIALATILPLVWLLFSVWAPLHRNILIYARLEANERRLILKNVQRQMFFHWQTYVAFIVCGGSGYGIWFAIDSLWRESINGPWVLLSGQGPPLLGGLIAFAILLPCWSRLFRQNLVSHSLCASCGYDVHASVDRCSECGVPIPQDAMSA
jgi:hypothetical protein